jgi:hypothetical protein
MDPDRRRSLMVNLSVLGIASAIAIPYLPAGAEFRRNLYRDRESCMRDYSADQCEGPQNSAGSGGSAHGGGVWRGPRYYSDRSLPEARSDPGAGRFGLSSGNETSIRGGFGRVGRALRAVG